MMKNRRSLLAVQLPLLTLSILLLLGGCEQAAAPDATREKTVSKAVKLVNRDGSYPVKALEKDTVVLTVIQSGVKSLADFPSPAEGLQYNLAHMRSLAEKACSAAKKPDILLFHEFPLTGYSPGSREDVLKHTIEIPGPETAALGEVARNCDAYLVFGSYARDEKDWPGHILSINTVIGRDGNIVKKFWKSRNIKRLYKNIEITTTTIESVRDRYRALYGIEEEFPVIQTEFGNLAVSTVQLDPFIFAAFAMRGTEIMLRTATLYSEEDLKATARMNNFYSAMANIVLPPELGFQAGNSMIVAPDGKVLAREASETEEGIISAEIPLADFRRNRTLPNYALALTQPVFEQYQEEIPLNHMDLPREQLPQTGEAMKALLDRLSRFAQ
jgi:predicted amidohydrolase